MSPLIIGIVFHYNCGGGVDDADGFHSLDVVDKALDELVLNGILEFRPSMKRPPGKEAEAGPKYKITERGKAYVDALMLVPFPELVWMSPEEKKAYQRPEKVCPFNEDRS